MNRQMLYDIMHRPGEIVKKTFVKYFTLLGLLLFTVLQVQAQISGPSTVCSGEPAAFTLAGASSSSTCTWSVSPSTGSTFLGSSYTGATVQWVTTTVTTCTLSVSVSNPPASPVVWNKVVTIIPQPNPQITTSTIVGCQGNEPDKERKDVEGTIINDGACIKVCENSTVDYDVVNGQPGSTYQWTIDGTKGTIMGSSTGTTLTVNWGTTLGYTYVKVKETTAGGCSKEKTVCIEVIESPHPKIKVNGDSVVPGGNPCFMACEGEKIYFEDLTPVSASSPIVSWFWDFGDGQYSNMQNPPPHVYPTAATYTVKLKVTNQCGCIGYYDVCIEVNPPDQIPAEIKCPSIVCENTPAEYTIDNTCSDMVWDVNGGTITSSTMTSVNILWDNVGPSGFGEVIADFSNCGGNCSPKVIARVPVIQQHGIINGKTVICKNKQYKYTLPQWPATNFKWSVSPAGNATIMSYDENSYEVDIVATGPFTLHCDYINTLMLCAGTSDLVINVTDPLQLTAAERICLGTSTSVVTTTPSASGTSYTFINPNGIISASGTFNMTGTWTIEASNPSFCEITPITVEVVDPPAAMSSISGESKVCLNNLYVYDAVSPLPNTTCSWTITPASAGTIISNSGNSVTVKWLTTGAKTLSVSRVWADLPGCASAPFSFTVNDAIPSINISGNTTPCANTAVTYSASLAAGSSEIDDIVWSLSCPGLGSVSAGQNTMSPTISWNNTTAVSTACTLIATITKCGNTTTATYPVSVIGVPSISIAVSNPTPCSGTPVTFTATTTPASATVNWALTGGSPSSATGSSAVTTFTNLGNASQNFTITATAAASGCLLTGNASYTIAVKPQPNINVSPGSGSSSTILTCAPVNIPLLLSTNATMSIKWYLGASLISTGSTSVTATTTGTYKVDVQNSFGCESSVTRVVALDPSCGPGCTLPAGAGVASKSHTITSCLNASNAAVVDVNFNSISSASATYPSATIGAVASLSVSGSSTYCTVPSPTISFPNVTVNGITITKPGVYPITLKIGYNTSSGICYKLETENVIVPVIADFDYITNCSGGGYTLTLNDQSPILSGYSSTSQTWTINGGTVATPSSVNLSAYTPGSTLTIVHTITVSNGSSSYTCSRTRTYVVPTVIVPAFSISTTDPTGPTTSSCAGREVLFTSLNNTGVTQWSWAFGDGSSYVSNSSVTATRTYSNPAATYTPTIVLTLTDAFGCTYNTSNQITLYKNTLSLNTTNTYSAQSDLLCEGSSSSVQLVGVSGGYGSFTYEWYREQTPLVYTTNPISVAQNGQYWTRVTDLHGCRIAANPTAADRAFQPLPDVAISGKHDYCPYEAIKLNAMNGASTGITYQWEQYTGSSWVSVSGATAGILNIAGGLPVGVYQYRIVATQTLPSPYTSTCSAISPAFVVTVHAAPNVPSLASPLAVNCADYSIQLSVISPQPGVVYNWSNGTIGTPTIVNHGGPYRVWATNTWGCKSQADINVPIEPAAYFWRFPYGCYSFCRQQLPRQIDGPSYIPFSKWEWFINGGTLPYPNGSWAAAGSGTVVDPLNINADPTMGGDGNGSGDYQWYLDNGLCDQMSHMMSISIKDKCCTSEAVMEYFRCITPEGSTTPLYYGGIHVYGPDCDPTTATYTIYAVDPVTGLPNGTVSPPSGSYTPGALINFTYTPFAGVTQVKFIVVVHCGEDCISEIETITLSQYDCPGTHPCDADFAWDYFTCVWPKGAAAPYFVGSFGLNNPFGCESATYYITAVDPATGLPNGTVSPSSGTLPPGWSGVNFTYTPNPGATTVRFTLTIMCDGQICILDLGEFRIDEADCMDSPPKRSIQGNSFTHEQGTLNMNIVPNPADMNVQISYDIPDWKEGDNYQMAIVNLLGQTIDQYNITNAKGVWQYATQQMPAGMYFVRLTKSGVNLSVQRMVITH